MQVIEGRASIDAVDAFVDQLSAIGERHDVAVQAFDATRLAGIKHLAAAVERANRAHQRDEMITNNRAVEILCYAAARRQINEALKLGVSPGAGPIAIVIDGLHEDGAAAAVRELIEPEPVLGVVSNETKIMEWFDITEQERSATEADLETLVIERVALLVIDK